jgi:hypothetical protein
MRILVGAAAGWIAFSLADKALYDGRIVQDLARFAQAIAAGFGFHF